MKRLSIYNFSPLRRIALVVSLHSAWFWVPIWVLYYRRFTNYQGVALLEALSMGVSMLMIVPGGMLSDWIGRKRLLIIASIVASIGAIGAGFTPSFSFLIVFILFLSLAGGLYQSSIHALIYDTLKSNDQEYRYERVLGKIITVQMLSTAFASAVGGYLYQIDVRYPWFAVSLFTGISAFVAFSLKEPQIETKHDTFSQFIKEAGRGMMLLLQKEWRIAIPIICAGIFLTTDASGFWDIQAVEFGFSSIQLGILLTSLYIALAGVSLVTPRILRGVHEQTIIVISIIIFSLCWFTSSFAFGVFGGVLLIMRSMTQVIYDLKTSVVWNRMIPSSIRATTLSTITIVRGLPYILVSWGMGILLDTIGIRPLARTFSMLLFLVSLGMMYMWRNKRAQQA